jgi:alanyl-tRNA synthetase
VVLAAGSQPAGVLIACSPDSGINAGALLKEILAQAGGRGGGSAALAQGGLPSPEVLTQLRSRLGFDV